MAYILSRMARDTKDSGCRTSSTAKDTYYFQNNNKYVGLWFRDFQHGHGVMYYYNGDKYDGDWYKDKRQGKGTYTYSNGAQYKGQWMNDMKNGNGFFDWGDGTTYDGQWVDNQRSGKDSSNMLTVIPMLATGRMTSRTVRVSINSITAISMKVIIRRVSVPVKEFSARPAVRNTPDSLWMVSDSGQGTFVWKNGDIYVGSWKDDLQNGRGKLTKKNGDIFEGEFRRDMWMATW